MSDPDNDPAGPTLDAPGGVGGYDDAAVGRARSLLDAIPERVGPYRILERLGRGGMGEVYVAEQTHPIKRRVALKVIKAGMDTRQVVARFEAERQALAMMDHPNVARVFDAGTTDAGRPYFVMELIRGVPITDFCDEAKLTTRQRVELLVPVCQAVQHAHQKGIIHRDLKPSNVLVTLHDGKPVPKVIDFGIAKATGPSLTDKTVYTEFRQMIGTPAYMSPEQAEMSGLDIDTRSDVYSLGVLAYELLTGSTPFDTERLVKAGLAEIGRIIKEEDPPTPSRRLSTLGERLTRVAIQHGTDAGRIGKLIAGELDWIVMRAMEKDRRRRYETVNDLIADLNRHLAGEPVLAAPPSWAYRARKFSRKYRKALITTAASAVIVLAGLATTTWQWRVARRNAAEAVAQKTEAEAQRRVAEQQTMAAERKQKESDAIVDFIKSDIFVGATPERMPDKTMRDAIVEKMLDPAAKALHGKFKDQPSVEEAVESQIAGCFVVLGRWPEADVMLNEVLANRRKRLGNDDRDTIASMAAYAYLLQFMHREDECLALFKEAIERTTKLSGADDGLTLGLMSNYGMAFKNYLRPAEGEPILKRVLDTYRRVNGEDADLTLKATCSYAQVLMDMHRYADAASLLEAAIPRSRNRSDEGAEWISTVLIETYGVTLERLGRPAEILPLLKDAVDRCRRRFGDEHFITLEVSNDYAYMLSRSGRLQEAEAASKQVMEAYRHVLGDRNPTAALSINNYGRVLQDLHRDAEAAPFLKLAIDTLIPTYPDKSADAINVLGNYVGVLVRLGRYGEAEPLAKDALERSQRVFGDDDKKTFAAMCTLATLLDELNKSEEQLPLNTRLNDQAPKMFGADSNEAIIARCNYGRTLQRLGRIEEAEPLLKDGLNRYSTKFGADKPEALQMAANYADVLAALGRTGEAEPLYKHVLDRVDLLGSDQASFARDVARRYADFLDAHGRGDEADRLAVAYHLKTTTTTTAASRPDSRPSRSTQPSATAP